MEFCLFTGGVLQKTFSGGEFMRIDASSLIMMKPEFLEMLKNMELGDVLKGRVMEVLENSISIRTAAGQFFTAVLQDNIEIRKGAFVELIIKDIVDGQVFAEIKGKSAPNDFDAKVAQMLKEMNLPVNEKNMQAAKLLFKYNMPLNRDSIVSLTNLHSSIENLNRSHEGKIGLLFSELDLKEAPVEVLNRTAIVTEAEISKMMDKLEKVQENEQAVIKETESATGKHDGSSEVSEANKQVEKPLLEQYHQSGREIQPEDTKQAELVGSKLNADKAETLDILAKMGVELDNKVKEFAVKADRMLQVFKDIDMEDLTFLLSKNMEVNQRNVEQLVRHKNNEDKISEFLGRLQNLIEEDESQELKSISDSISRVFLKPDEIQEPEQIKEKYQEIIKLGERLERLLEEDSLRNGNIREVLSNLKDNIDFIKSINQFSNYLQIPININNNTETAKLYVFKEGKRNKAIDPRNATILLALDLPHSGHLESLVAVQGKSINITFRIEDKRVGELIKNHSEELGNSLSAKGYSLKPIKIINLGEPFSLMVLESMMNNNKDRVHFDERV
jgi:hypothetical protein